MEAKPVASLAAAVMDYFGKKPGQTSAEFLQEYKALSDKDKSDFRDMLKAIGYVFP